MGLGFGEIVLILFVVLLVFGAGRLPTLGDSMGKALRNFKKAATGQNEIDVTPPAAQVPPKDPHA
jgi:sec-independent protein translocase protein TatA